VGRSAKIWVLLGVALVAGCSRASPSSDRIDAAPEGLSRTAPKDVVRPINMAPTRAWPVAADRGVAVGPTSASAEPLTLVTGEAARAAAADRCPDHDECVRIANNEGDVALAACDRECARCCLHQNPGDCTERECATACRRCVDAACGRAVCNDAWLADCRKRCGAEAATCAGCREVWCGDGASRRGCHTDAEALHAARLAACERDCKAPNRQDDGSCMIACGTAQKNTCTKAAKACALGTSPDCRCECSAAVLGACVAWNSVCVCD
jgi:hypothetical protein